MEPVTLELLARELGHIRATVDAIAAAQGPASLVQDFGMPYQRRELMLSEIDPATIDGQTIQADGSTWAYDQGVAKGMIYGYISPEKDPAQWDRMVTAFGGNEAHLRATLGIDHEPYLRWKVKPDAWLLLNPGPEALNQLAYALSQPLPPMRPTA